MQPSQPSQPPIPTLNIVLQVPQEEFMKGLNMVANVARQAAVPANVHDEVRYFLEFIAAGVQKQEVETPKSVLPLKPNAAQDKKKDTVRPKAVAQEKEKVTEGK